ncbi:MAG: S1 RNA-binding domain-containing protein [Candidatus Izemoplasmatales bacterium]|nr:S1 RNA-binding domain-containing protein [Candidatus Izemoplasmatales bacterium]
MKKGDLVKGRVTSIKPYGAFVKINEETDGLIHISEISDGFVRSVEDFINVGDVIDLIVLGFNKDNKVSLSYKNAQLNRKKKYQQIDLKSGFKPLEEKLPSWIAEYSKGKN